MVFFLILNQTSQLLKEVIQYEHNIHVPMRGMHDPFCHALMPATTIGLRGEPTVHVVIANRGVAPLISNMICGLLKLGKPHVAILAMDNATCPYLESHPLSKHEGGVICIPYLDRMLKDMGELEPLSIKQISDEGVKDLNSAAT